MDLVGLVVRRTHLQMYRVILGNIFNLSIWVLFIASKLDETDNNWFIFLFCAVFTLCIANLWCFVSLFSKCECPTQSHSVSLLSLIYLLSSTIATVNIYLHCIIISLAILFYLSYQINLVERVNVLIKTFNWLSNYQSSRVHFVLSFFAITLKIIAEWWILTIMYDVYWLEMKNVIKSAPLFDLC